MRRDLTERQLEELLRWARRLPERDKGEQVIAVVSELNALRQRECDTRFLTEIEGDV
jgi:hypothetical protein